MRLVPVVSCYLEVGECMSRTKKDRDDRRVLGVQKVFIPRACDRQAARGEIEEELAEYEREIRERKTRTSFRFS